MKIILYFRCVVFFLIGFALFQSCKKDAQAVNPEVQTLSVVTLSPSSVTFKGSIVKVGNSSVLDYGFVYSFSSNFDQNTGTKVSFGSSPKVGDYTRQVNGIVSINSYQNTLYVRAYLTNSKGTVFGSMVSVNMPTLSIGSVSPQSGKSGDQVTFTGQFFSPTIDQVNVSFGNMPAKVISVSDSKIVAEIPSGIPSSDNSQIQVQIIIGGRNLNAGTSFTILANVKDFAPKTGPIGTQITFIGDNLPSYYSNNLQVLFGQVPVSIGYYNNLQVAVPPTITSDTFPITMIINGKSTVLSGNFKVTAPTITAISPTSSLAGGYFVITGTNLPANFSYGSNPTATLGSTLVYPNIASDTRLSFSIPTDISPGSYTFTLKVGPYNIVAPQKLKVITPSISTFTPLSGGPGTAVDIQGTFIQGQGYNVMFGSIYSYGTASSSTTLRAYVPAGVQPGNVDLSVVINGQSLLAKNKFKVVGPSITSFSPTSGVAGTVITINGAGFDPNTYNTVVKFGTVAAPIVTATGTSISVMVPSNIPPGAMKLSVITSGQTVVSTTNFTITN
jgi:hypothetical protein